MEKRKGRSLNAIYCRPLPVPISVDKHGQLPTLTGHNPVSCAFLVWRVASLYLRGLPQEPKVKVSVSKAKDGLAFLVEDEQDMTRLWQQGFFGKGTLSRSEPSWKQRVQRKLEEKDGEYFKEDFTKARRDERKKFKALRGKAQSFEALSRSRELTLAEQEEYKGILMEMETSKARPDQPESQKSSEKDNSDVGKRSDKDGISSDLTDSRAAESAGSEVAGQLQNLEFLQLQNTEAFFLSFALDAVEVTHDDRQLSQDELLRLCMGTPGPGNRFMLHYVVYHHFRSLGWCVRSGVKFGTDMLLYKRGPPFMHAEFAILIIPNDGSVWTTWEDFMATARVVTGVKKTLVLVYVDVPSKEEFFEIFGQELDSAKIRRLLQLYKVTEVVYKRWSPSRTRD